MISQKNRLLLLILVTLVPLFVFVFYNVYDRYSDARKNATSDLQSLNKAFSIEQEKSIEATRHILVALSDTPQVKNMNPSVCSTYLSGFISNYKRYANFGVLNKNGELVCSGVATTDNLNFKDKQYLKRTLDSLNFAVGEFQIGTITKKAVINFGYPILDDNRKIKGIVFASLDLSWVNQFVTQAVEGQNITLLVLDHNGTILARNGDSDSLIGENFSNDPLVKEIFKKEGGITETNGIDSVKRIYAFNRIGIDNPIYVVTGKTSQAVFKDASNNLVFALISIFIVAIFSIISSWQVGKIIFVKKLEDLEKLDKLKSEFIAIASHQLRTPLSAISWFMELLSEEKRNFSKDQIKIIRSVKESNIRMVDLVESLLNVTKVESGKVNLEITEFLLNDLVSEVIKEVSFRYKAKNQKVIFKPINKIKITSDRKLLFEVFKNLLVNSSKYSLSEKNTEIEIKRLKNNILIQFSDNGFGILRSEKSKLFTKFFRGSNIVSKDIEGSGLGLYISKLIMTTLKGDLDFKPKKGGGSVFTIYINKRY